MSSHSASQGLQIRALSTSPGAIFSTRISQKYAKSLGPTSELAVWLESRTYEPAPMRKKHVFGSLLLLAANGVACSSSGGGNGFGGDTDSGTPAIADGGGGTIDPTDGSVGPPTKTIVYAHTDTTLYQLDPQKITDPMVKIGDFDCVGSGKTDPAMTDIAVSKDGALFGVSQTGAYPLEVQGTTVHCKATWPLPSSGTVFYGITMAPENTVDTKEVLIAANDNGQLYRIDETTGKTTQVGTMGNDSTGTPWALSGDIVFLANGGNPVGFATVRTCPKSKCIPTDTLIEIDVAKVSPGTKSALKAVRGQTNKGAWCTNAASPDTFTSMFGIAAFEDKVYGFSRKGELVEIHNDDGTACLVTADPLMKFAGAGVTTTAPVKAPPPK
jgi:hypothetical protein